MLIDIICEEAIQLGIDAKNWEEAIELSANPLVTEKKIEKRYIEAMIQSVLEHGPYFVLLPGVALAHARPEDGVLENSIGITRLKEGVSFGNRTNDPVKYIFTLSALSDKSHLNALAQLAVLFEDEQFFKLLDHGKDVSEIIKYIKEEGLYV